MANDVYYVLSLCERIAEEEGRPLDRFPRYDARTDTIVLRHRGATHEIAWSVLPMSRIGWHPGLKPMLRDVIRYAPFAVVQAPSPTQDPPARE